MLAFCSLKHEKLTWESLTAVDNSGTVEVKVREIRSVGVVED